MKSTDDARSNRARSSEPSDTARKYHYPISDDEVRWEAVVAAIAEVTERATIDLQPLYEVIDPDALDALDQGGSDVAVRFPYEGYDVVVSPGAVTVQDLGVWE